MGKIKDIKRKEKLEKGILDDIDAMMRLPKKHGHEFGRRGMQAMKRVRRLNACRNREEVQEELKKKGIKMIIVNDENKCKCGAYWTTMGCCCNGHARPKTKQMTID